MTRPELSVVVPSFKGAQRLRATLPRILHAIAASDVTTAEVVIVDDGSDAANRDALARLLEENGRSASVVTTTRAPRVGAGVVSGIVESGRRGAAVELLLVCLPANRGQQEATIIGTGLTRGELVATLDDDGDHPPSELPAMVATMRNNPKLDLLYAAPRGAAGSIPRYRRIGTFLNNLMFRVSVGKPWHVPVTSFRLVRADHLIRALSLSVRYPYLSAMLFGVSPAPHVAVHWYEARGTSPTRYSPFRLGSVFFGLLLYWGPLRLIGRLLRRRRPFDIAGGCS